MHGSRQFLWFSGTDHGEHERQSNGPDSRSKAANGATLFCACGGLADVQGIGDGEEHLGQVREFDAGRDYGHDHRGPILENQGQAARVAQRGESERSPKERIHQITSAVYLVNKRS